MTVVQRRTLLAIQRHVAEQGRAPTYAELQAAIGASSRAHVFAILHRLIDQGHLSITKGLSRSMRVTRPIVEGEFFVFDPLSKELVPYVRASHKESATA